MLTLMAQTPANLFWHRQRRKNFADTTVNVTLPAGQFIASGTQYMIISNTGTGALLIPGQISDNFFTTDFVESLGGTDNNDLIIIAIRANTYQSAASMTKMRAKEQRWKAMRRQVAVICNWIRS